MSVRLQAASPRRSVLRKLDSSVSSDRAGKHVIFDEVRVKEYPIVLGDNPAVSCGAPITIGWKPSRESVMNVDIYEYCRGPERKGRKKLILSVRRRAGVLLSSGYSLEQIANATLNAQQTKQERAESLKSAGWTNPFEMLSGAVETTGMALKRADILGVGAAAGAVVGAGVQGVSDVTVQTGRFIVSGAKSSTRVVTGVANDIAGGVVGAGKAVARPVYGAGKLLVVKPVVTTGKAIGTGITSTGRAVGSVVSSTGRALSYIVNPGAADRNGSKRSPKRGNSPKRSNPQSSATIVTNGISDFSGINAQ